MSGQKLLLSPLHCQKTVCKGRFCVLPDPYFTHQATAIPIRKVNISASGSVLSSTSMETQAGCQATAGFGSTCETLQVFKVSLHLRTYRLRFRITNSDFVELLSSLLAQAPALFGGKANLHQVHTVNVNEVLARPFKDLGLLKKN